MAGPTIDLTTAERLADAERVVEQNFDQWVAGHPELRSLNPMALGGWSQLLAGIALVQGAMYGYTADATARIYLEDLQATRDLLRQPSVDTADLASALRRLRADQSYLRSIGVDPGTIGDSSVVPSPNAIQAARDARLAEATARIAVWQKAHHGRVHVPLTQAESEESAAVHPFTQAAVDLSTATVSGFKAVVGHLLPELRRQVVELVRTETQLRRLADVEIRTDFRLRVQELAQRVGDVVRWLRTEALPDLEEQIKAERAARKETDHKLTVGLATTTNTLEGELTELATAVAPLTAWMGGFGLHTTTKVRNNEGLIDQLGSGDWGQLLALSSFPGLAALTVDILARTVPHVPDVVAGLERAAFDALGAVT